MSRHMSAATLGLLLAVSWASAQAPATTAAASLQNAAQTSLGATATGSGAPFNRDWPADGAIGPEGARPHGALFGTPMVGGRVDIRLVIPVDICAVELVPLDYHGTLQPKSCDLLVDNKPVAHADLPQAPGKPFRVAVAAHGQKVAIVVTATHPPRELDGGKPGPSYGGWQRIRVLTSTDVAAALAPDASYQVALLAADIAPTAGSLAGGACPVEGRPRITPGHPCTIWDREDIDRYKAMLATSPLLRQQLDGLRRAMDRRIGQPLGVPQPRRDARGAWAHVSDRETGAAHNALALDIANLGTLYVLTGDARYGAFAKRLLLAYAEAYPHYGVGAREGFSHDPSRVFDQRLSDAIWLIQVARGYDLIHDLPSITPDERRLIEETFIRAAARFIIANTSHLRGATNWSAIGTCAALIAGVATDDEELTNRALFGLNSDKHPARWWEGHTNRVPSGVELHFSAKTIDDDGMWAEGAMGYQFMALQALVTDAEILWHHGIDLYRYRDAALKRLFDSPIQFSYPDLTTPAIHDSGFGSIVGREAYLYEFAYRRYRDPRYLPLLRQAGQHLATQYQQWPVSVLYDVDLTRPGEPTEPHSVNLFGVGYGILRLTDLQGTRSLLLDAGPNRSHGHPDKLNIDLWAFGERLIPDPGSVWYEQPVYRRWYQTTLGHNTLVVDERDQQPAAGEQLVFAPAETLALQRARCDTAASGVQMDRALVMTADYVADLFGAFARRPRTLDLAWHVRGAFTSDLAFAAAPFPEPVENGYNELANPRRATTDGAYATRCTLKGRTVTLHAAAGAGTTVIAGEGHLGMERPTTLLQRRHTASTVYGNVVDLSGSNVVRAVACEGGLEAGHALLRITTSRGEDLCFAAYRPGPHAIGGVETDGQQAFVRRDGASVIALALAGGTSLRIGDIALSRNEPGLACVERVENGACLVANPSPTPATLTIALPGLSGRSAFLLDAGGARTGSCPVTAQGGAVVIRLPAGGRAEFTMPGAVSVQDVRRAVLLQRQQAEEAERVRAREAAAARSAAREAAARTAPAPAGTLVVVQAESFSAQGGGEIKLSETKQGAIGSSLLGWDGAGQWLEWTVAVPDAGAYNLGVVYCTDKATTRALAINGAVQEPEPIPLPATGGFSNGSDDWQLLVAPDPVAEHPLLVTLRAGTNTIRLTSTTGGSANMDYIVICSPDLQPARAACAEWLRQHPSPPPATLQPPDAHTP